MLVTGLGGVVAGGPLADALRRAGPRRCHLGAAGASALALPGAAFGLVPGVGGLAAVLSAFAVAARRARSIPAPIPGAAG